MLMVEANLASRREAIVSGEVTELVTLSKALRVRRLRLDGVKFMELLGELYTREETNCQLRQTDELYLWVC